MNIDEKVSVIEAYTEEVFYHTRKRLKRLNIEIYEEIKGIDVLPEGYAEERKCEAMPVKDKGIVFGFMLVNKKVRTLDDF
jgi:hypothetical protein